VLTSSSAAPPKAAAPVATIDSAVLLETLPLYEGVVQCSAPSRTIEHLEARRCRPPSVAQRRR
jgi:hypothetical protein